MTPLLARAVGTVPRAVARTTAARQVGRAPPRPPPPFASHRPLFACPHGRTAQEPADRRPSVAYTSHTIGPKSTAATENRLKSALPARQPSFTPPTTGQPVGRRPPARATDAGYPAHDDRPHHPRAPLPHRPLLLPLPPCARPARGPLTRPPRPRLWTSCAFATCPTPTPAPRTSVRAAPSSGGSTDSSSAGRPRTTVSLVHTGSVAALPPARGHRRAGRGGPLRRQTDAGRRADGTPRSTRLARRHHAAPLGRHQVLHRNKPDSSFVEHVWEALAQKRTDDTENGSQS